MEEEKKKKTEWLNLMTPKVTMLFMNFVSPDAKYKKYGATPLLDPNILEHKAFIDHVNKLNSDLFDREIVKITKDRDDYRVKKTFKDDYQKDKEGTETPTGFLRFKLTSNERKPVRDASGKNPVPDAQLVKMWSGTKGKLKISAKPYIDADKQRIGYVFYLQAVQIIEPKWGTAREEFDAEEGWNSEEAGFNDEQGTAPSDAATGTPDGKPKGDF